jgi:predicted DCC family thiol-disulfide oxidoreductase YuxK
MKQDKVIIYDDSCPLCTWYTGVFTRTGFLDKDGRQPFCSIGPEFLNRIDPQRSKNEIPLVDRRSGEVLYGVEALLDILGQRLPLVKTIGNFPIVNWIIRRFYKLISYNRRIIVAAERPATGFDCTPEFNPGYRLAFMIFCLFLNTSLLLPLHHYVFGKSVFSNTSEIQLQAAHFALVLSNLGIASRLKKLKAFEYLGQVTMLALLATLLTLPLILINQWWNIPLLNNAAFAAILLFTLKEYFRRMQFAGILQQKFIAPLNIFFLTVFLIYLSN